MKKETYHILILLLVDIFAVYLSVTLAFFTRPIIGHFIPLVTLSHGLSTYLFKIWIVLIIIVLTAYYRGYGLVVNIWDELLIFIRVLSLSFLIVWMIISLIKGGEGVSRIIITLSFFYMLVFMPLFRFVTKYLLYKSFKFYRQAYIFNDETISNEFISIVNREWYSGYKILNQIKEIGELKNKDIDVCFVPMNYINEEKIKNIKPYIKHFILLSEIPGLSFMNTEIKTFMGSNIALITVSSGLLSFQKTLIKRGFDIILSTLGLLIFSPFFLFIPIIIKLDTSGPAIFKHRRCGKNLVEFEMYKFRTMYKDAELELNGFLSKNPDIQKELNEKNKIENDPRITRVGRILRKTSLDELPQLFNVLKGDMSIVGPRPDSRIAIDKYYNEYKEIYSHVRPGITGLWQVSGRSNIKYDERVKLDYFYVLNWSMWLDIVIIIKTFGAIISAKGAY